MYFFYNRALCGYLTTKGWISAEVLGSATYKLLGFASDVTARAASREVYEKYGTTTANMTILLKQSNLKKNNASKLKLSETEEKIIKNGFVPIVQLLIQRKAQQISSAKLFSDSAAVKKEQAAPTIAKILEEIASEIDGIEIDDIEVDDIKIDDIEIDDIEIDDIEIDDIKIDEIEIEKAEETEVEEIKEKIVNNIPNEKDSFIEKLLYSSETMKDLYKESSEILRDYETLLDDVESQLEDELHFIEFNVLNGEESVKFAWNLHELRKKRRQLKDALFAAALLQETFDHVRPFENISTKLEGLSNRRYHLRSPDHFDH